MKEHLKGQSDNLRNVLRNKLQPLVDTLESERLKNLKRGKSNKNYFLFILLAVMPYGYIKYIGLLDDSVLHYYLLSLMTIAILYIYVTTDPLSVIAPSRIKQFNRIIKDIFAEGFEIVDPAFRYKPIHKTHQSHFDNCGLFGKSFKVERESNALILLSGNTRIRLSEIFVFGQLSCLFQGFFIVIKPKNLSNIDLNDLKDTLKDYHKLFGPIEINQHKGLYYLTIPEPSRVMDLDIKEHQSINMEAIIDKIMHIQNVFSICKSMAEQIESPSQKALNAS